MLHPRKDYERIQDPAGLIPENEPVFILRAQDQVAARVVRAWALYNAQEGGDPQLTAMANLHAQKMDAWPVHKLADLPTEQQGDVAEQGPGGPAEAEQQQIENLKQEATEQPAETEQPTVTAEQKKAIIEEHISHLPGNITTREQVIASAGIFIEGIKTELAVALGCPVEQVPEKIADFMGFTANETQTRPGSGVIGQES